MRKSLALLAVVALAPAPAWSDEWLEWGETYFIVRHDPNAGGAVYLRVDMLPDPPYDIVTTVLGVEAFPGWTYQVDQAGGVNAPVDVRFESKKYRIKFKVLYAPGRTVIDYGELKKR